MGIFRRSRGNENWGMPEGMDLSGAAAYVVREMQQREAQTRHAEGAALEYIEVVEVDVDAEPTTAAREPGILMSWHQGTGRYGLLASISSLLTQSGSLEQLISDLSAVIDLPQYGDDAVRTWFAGLPLPTRVG